MSAFTPRTSPFQILVVEDDLGDVLLERMAYEQCCNYWPIDIHHVVSGETCLAFLRREGEYANAPRPDLILLDYKLPVLDGIEALEHMVSDPVLRGFPVVLFTGSMSESDIQRAYDLRCSTYVEKPLELEEMKRVICCIFRYWFSVATLP